MKLISVIGLVTALLATPTMAGTCDKLEGRGGSVVVGDFSLTTIYTFSADYSRVCVYSRGNEEEENIAELYMSASESPIKWEWPKRYAPHEVIWPEGVTHD